MYSSSMLATAADRELLSPSTVPMSASVRLSNMLPIPSPPHSAVPQLTARVSDLPHVRGAVKPRIAVDTHSIYSRQIEWHAHVRARTSAMQREQALQQVTACTFRPNTVKVDGGRATSSNPPRFKAPSSLLHPTPLTTSASAGCSNVPEDVAAAKAAVDIAFALAQPFIHAIRLTGPTPRAVRQELNTRPALTRDSTHTQTSRALPSPPRRAAARTPTRSTSAPLTRISLSSTTPKTTADGPLVPPLSMWHKNQTWAAQRAQRLESAREERHAALTQRRPRSASRPRPTLVHEDVAIVSPFDKFQAQVQAFLESMPSPTAGETEAAEQPHASLALPVITAQPPHLPATSHCASKSDELDALLQQALTTARAWSPPTLTPARDVLELATIGVNI
jgi:hypothetical protein